jgi:hypothetical protein
MEAASRSQIEYMEISSRPLRQAKYNSMLQNPEEAMVDQISKLKKRKSTKASKASSRQTSKTQKQGSRKVGKQAGSIRNKTEVPKGKVGKD